MKFLKKNNYSLVLLFIILLLFGIILFLDFKEHFVSDTTSQNDYTIKNSYQCINNKNIIDINKEYSYTCNLGNDVLTKDKNCLDVALEKCKNNATCLGVQEFKQNKKTLAKYKLCKDNGKEIPQSSHVAYAYKLYKKNDIPNIQEPITEPITEPIAEPITEPITEPIIEPTTEPTTESITEPIIEPITEPITEPIIEPITEPITEPHGYNLSENLKTLIKQAKCFSPNSPNSPYSPHSPHSQNKCSSRSLLNNFN